MFRRAFIASVAAGLAMPGLAQENDDKGPAIRLTAAQIETLLSGNTVIGTWSGSGYKQYYGEGGLTVYLPEGGQPDEGKWRTNPQNDDYESWWRSTGWTPYPVVMTNDGFAWVNGPTLEPFIVETGKRFDW